MKGFLIFLTWTGLGLVYIFAFVFLKALIGYGAVFGAITALVGWTLWLVGKAVAEAIRNSGTTSGRNTNRMNARYDSRPVRRTHARRKSFKK